MRKVKFTAQEARLAWVKHQTGVIDTLVEALESARRQLVVAIIANSGGLFDHSNIGDHLGIAKIDAALAKARGEA